MKNNSRRAFLTGLAIGGLGAALPLSLYFNFHHLWRTLGGFLPDKVSEAPTLAARLKKVFGFTEQDLGRVDWSRFVRPTYNKQTLRLWQMMKDQELKDFLSAAIKRDYYEEKVIEADGWILSETEVFLYNMIENAK